MYVPSNCVFYIQCNISLVYKTVKLFSRLTKWDHNYGPDIPFASMYYLLLADSSVCDYIVSVNSLMQNVIILSSD